jgi:glutaredoxin
MSGRMPACRHCKKPTRKLVQGACPSCNRERRKLRDQGFSGQEIDAMLDN